MQNFLVLRAAGSDSKQGQVFGIGIAFIIFIFIVICLRMYVRSVLIKAVGLDDITMVIGTILTFALSVASMIAAHYGVGKHVDDIPQENMVPMQQAVYSTRVIYVVGLMFIKVSLLLFYLRLDQRKYMKWTVYSLLFFVLGLSIPSAFILAFSCTPPSKFWDFTGEAPGKCMDAKHQQAFYDANGILNIVTDVLIYITPIPMIWKVQITKRKKGALFGIFGLGIFAIVAGCVRYHYVRLLSDAGTNMFYNLADSLNWCALESYVAIFCGCAPSLSVLIKTYAPRFFGTSVDTGQRHNSNGAHQLHDINSRFRGTNMRRKGSRAQLSQMDDITLAGSEEAIVESNSKSNDNSGGILLTTELRMDVTHRGSDDASTCQEGYRGL
ncbi:hypothetical protein VTO42DRAFT_1405 [Malbranchea cinnamomea]